MSEGTSSPTPRSQKHVEIAVFRMRSRLRRRSTMAPYPFRPESLAWKKFTSLDGENSSYTTVLLICMNLALLVWFFERGILEGRNKNWFMDHIDMGIAAKRLFRSLILIFCAIFNGFLAFLLLAMNLRDIQSMPATVAKRWLFFSGMGFLVANGCASYMIYSAQKSYEWRRDEGSYEKPFPHYMILSIFAFFMVVMNTMYIRTVYLPFVRTKIRGWELVRRNLHAILELGRRERGETSCYENMMHHVMCLVYRIVGAFNFLIFHYFECYETGFRWCYRVYRNETSCLGMKTVSHYVSEVTLAPVRLIRWSPLIQFPLCLSRTLNGILKRLSDVFRPLHNFANIARTAGGQVEAPWYQRVFRGVLQVLDRFLFGFSNIKPEIQRMANELWENTKEDETYSHSSWLKAAAVTAAILLVYWGVVMANEFRGYMDDVYHPTRNCMINNPGVSNFFLRFIGFAPSNDEDTEDELSQNVCAMPLATLGMDPAAPPFSPPDPELIQNATSAAPAFVQNATSVADPTLVQNVTGDPAQIQNLATDPTLIQNVTSDPSQIQNLATDPSLIQNVTSDPAQIQNLATDPSLIQNVTSANPALVQGVASVTDPNLIQNVTSDPSQIQNLATNPSLIQNATSSAPLDLTDPAATQNPTSTADLSTMTLVQNLTADPTLAALQPALDAATQDSDAATLARFSQMLAARVRENRTEDRLYKCEEGVRDDNVCVMLSAVNMAEETLSNLTNSTHDPSDEFFDSFTGDMVYLFDVYMRNLEWAVWIGFAVGLLFGIWTLLSVMGQYKRLSLAIRSGLFTDFDIERQYELSRTKSQKMGLLKRVDSVITTHSFAKVISHYPMSTSIFFSGMLISTAILQLVVFGGLVASVFSLVASMMDDQIFTFVKPLLWTLLAFFITWMVNGPIATFVLGEGLLVSRFHVIHEIAFFMFLLVFTSVHLVVGLFLAFFRMLWVLLTSLVTINRLDKNLFSMYKERDIGHKSFMALILMQHVFHVNRSGNKEEKSLWADVLRQVESTRQRASNQKPVVRRHTSEPLELLDEEGNETDGEQEAEIMEQGQSAFGDERRLRHVQTSVQQASSFDLQKSPTQ